MLQSNKLYFFCYENLDYALKTLWVLFYIFSRIENTEVSISFLYSERTKDPVLVSSLHLLT